MLVEPRALAVTSTIPDCPGVQLVKAASQWPAQATPLEAKFRMEVSLEENVMGTFRVVPVVVCTEAVKLMLEPATIEVLAVGLRLILPAKRGGPAFLPPPQPAKAHIETIASNTPILRK